MSNVIPFRRLTPDEEKKRRRQVEEAGSHAWDRLLQARNKLSKPDRVALAEALYEEFRKLKANPGFRTKQFAFSAGFDSLNPGRDLYKHMLLPANDPAARAKKERGLKAAPHGYRRIIEAIREKTGENIKLLADRITWATSFHPRQVKDTEESKYFHSTLEEIVNQIDRNFPKLSGQPDTLHAVFMKTAKIKVNMRKNGGLLRWPYWDSDNIDDYLDEDASEKTDERYAYWPSNYYEVCGNEGWRYDYPSALSHYETITNLPRIYLGLTVNWTGWVLPSEKDVAAAKAEKRSKLRPHIGELAEIRDKNTGLARLVYRDPKSGKLSDSLSGPPYVDEWCHAWLTIYPTPDNSSLAPVIYTPAAEGGVELIHLNHRNFVKLKDMEFISEGAPVSLYDRIMQLIWDDNGRSEIREAWETTAPDVLQNPILREHRKKEQRRQNMHRHIWNQKTEQDVARKSPSSGHLERQPKKASSSPPRLGKAKSNRQAR